MIRRLAILGATGDLTARYLLPALAALWAGGKLGDGFQVVAVGRDNWADETFRNWAAAQLDRHMKELPSPAKHAVVATTRYHRADVTDWSSMAAVVQGPAPLAALHRAGTTPHSVVVLEKPFGEDLAGAIELNRLLSSLYAEQAIFRVDHFLAMATVQNLLGTRLANRVLEPIWNSSHISSVDIVWDESLALESRAGYYDGVGALKDMLQNHLLQLLCLVAMEPPISLGDRDLRDRKVDVLRSVRPLEADDVAGRTRRARYRGYVDEDGVTPEHGTETFAEVVLELDSSRWSGTKFRRRTGKALGRDRKEIAVRFRAVPRHPFDRPQEPSPNLLRFEL